MAKQQAAEKQPGLETRLRKTNLNHIYLLDINDDGRFREVAVSKMERDATGSIQSILYIDIALLDNVDKGRLKGIVMGQHADKYELWDLMSQQSLSNGKNALDYFHQVTRSVQGIGAVNTSLGGGLSGVKAESSAVIGADFSPTGRLDTGVIDATPAAQIG